MRVLYTVTGVLLLAHPFLGPVLASSSPNGFSSTQDIYSFDTNPTSSTLYTTTSTDTSSSSSSHGTTTVDDVTSAPTQTGNPSSLHDIDIMRTRRLSLIIESVTSGANISSWLSTLQTDGSWPASEIDYSSGCDAQRANWPAQNHWQRLVTMASAFHGDLENASQWTGSSELLSAVSLAMNYWFSNDFTNINCLAGGSQDAGSDTCPCGTPGFWNTNWFSNTIRIPDLVGSTCLLLNSNLTSTQLSNCTNMTGRSYATFDTGIDSGGVPTGANALDIASIGIDQALLTVNSTLLEDAYRKVHDDIVIQETVRADGIRLDGSFGQHSGIIYNGNYGQDYVNAVFAFEIVAAGTQFQAGAASQEAFETLIDGDQWMIYHDVETGALHWDFSVLGRFISFPVADNQATGSIQINLTQVQFLGEEWDSDTLTGVFESLSQSSTDANVGALNGNRMFHDNDYMVQRGPGYVSTLRMYSSRTSNTECLNSQNPFGFHLSDGTVYTYLTGSEYEDIAAAWDWNLIPGTTVDYNATLLSCNDTQVSGVESFVGGVSTGGIGLGAMRYSNPLTGSLHWQKAWFYLEDGAQHVMINNVSSATDAPVFSVLDQRKLTTVILVDGMPVESGNFTDALTLWHGNVGYAFTENSGTSLSVDYGPRTGSWSALGISTEPPPTVDLFAAWISHTDLDAPVSYTTFPAIDYGQFEDQLFKTSITDIQNDADISAVLDATHLTAMVVFWAAEGGTVTIPAVGILDGPITVSANKGLLLILEMDTWNLTVADSTQSASEVDVVLRLEHGRRPNGWTGSRVKESSVGLPTNGTEGSSVSISLF